MTGGAVTNIQRRFFASVKRESGPGRTEIRYIRSRDRVEDISAGTLCGHSMARRCDAEKFFVWQAAEAQRKR